MALVLLWIPFIFIIQIIIIIESIVQGIVAHAAWINAAVGVLLAANLLFMVLLLLLWFVWRRNGRLDLANIDRHTGWRRLCLLGAKYLLPLGAAWEGLIALLCGLYLVIQPLQYLAP